MPKTSSFRVNAVNRNLKNVDATVKKPTESTGSTGYVRLSCNPSIRMGPSDEKLIDGLREIMGRCEDGIVELVVFISR
jgi:hypothetical protein